MGQTTNVYFKEKLWFSDGFQADKTKRKLSKIINLLLISYYELEEEEKQQKTLTQIEAELIKIQSEKARLAKEKEYLLKIEEEDQNRYTIIE